MKKIAMFLLLLLCIFCLENNSYAAEYAKDPVAFILMDDSGEVDDSYFTELKRQVKQAYRYPHYEFIDTLEPTHIASEIIMANGKSTSKLELATLRKIAEEANAKVVALVIVHDLDEYFFESFGGLWGRFHDGPTQLVRVVCSADLYIYKADGDKMEKKILRKVDTEESPNYTPAKTVLKWTLRNLANRMEGREQI